jgi:hypothetical protein
LSSKHLLRAAVALLCSTAPLATVVGNVIAGATATD